MNGEGWVEGVAGETLVCQFPGLSQISSEAKVTDATERIGLLSRDDGRDLKEEKAQPRESHQPIYGRLRARVSRLGVRERLPAPPSLPHIPGRHHTATSPGAPSHDDV